jgi:hypothetical protein
MILIIDIT